MSFRRLAALLLLTGGWAGPANAQEVTVCPARGALLDAEARQPDLVIRASASAEEVRFSGEPRIHVRLAGCSVLDTVLVIERRNLPEPVRPNVTYRDVFIAIEILGHVDVECLFPDLIFDTQRAAPDFLTAVAGSLLARLCTPDRSDTLPRSSPGRDDP